MFEMSTLPEAVKRNAVLYFGDAGRAWLDALPELIETISQRWSLSVGVPFSNLSINVVVPVHRADGGAAVLKMGVPERELGYEAAALSWFDGLGSVVLLDEDPECGALLLEHLSPGASLRTVTDDDAATRIAADVMAVLHRPPPGAPQPFVLLDDWFDGLAKVRETHGGGSGPIPEALLDRAERVSQALLDDGRERVLLHGDLHCDNIVSASRSPWLAIDPKGIIGERTFEVCAYLRNALPLDEGVGPVRRRLSRRVDLFCERLGFDRQRVLDWAASEAVLSASWDLDDPEQGYRKTLDLAEIYDRMSNA